MAFDTEQSRIWMINHQVRPWNVVSPVVLSALGKIKREDFVPEAYAALAFADTQIPLPAGQHMLKPILEGRLLQALAPEPDHEALVIGTGSGFFTALVGIIAAQVTAIELHPELTNYAETKLARAKLGNVELHTADFCSWEPGRQFNRIVLTCGLPALDERLPEWLAEDGIAIVPIGEAPSMSVERITRTGSTYTRTRLFETVVPQLHQPTEESEFSF